MTELQGDTGNGWAPVAPEMRLPHVKWYVGIHPAPGIKCPIMIYLRYYFSGCSPQPQPDQ